MSYYNFKIFHVKGKENGRADALSRRPDYEVGTKDKPNLAMLRWDGDALVLNTKAFMSGEPVTLIHLTTT